MMKLIRWIGCQYVEENHRHDYRWIKDKEEREAWIRKYWEVEESDVEEKKHG